MARLALLLLLALATGCPAEGGDDDYPIGGGGGGGGTSGPRTDAGTGDGGGTGGGGTINGRVCLLSDLRRLINALPTDCATSGAGGISVSLGSSPPVTTQADGRFSIPAQEGTNLAWRVSRPNFVVPSVVPLSGSTLLPVIGDDDYNEISLMNGGVTVPGNGSIVARIIRAGAPVMAATAVLDAGQVEQTRYDGTNPMVWGTTATGALGVAWLPDNTAGTSTLRVTQGTTLVSVPVTTTPDSITFVTIALP